MNSLQERKLELERELAEINNHLENETKLNKTIEQINIKLRDVRKISPEAPLHDYDNVEESLSIFDDILNNPDKYRKRYEIITKIFKKIKMNEAYLISGTFVHSYKEVLKGGSVLEELFIRGTFDNENNLTLKTKITYEQMETLSDEYDIQLNGFDFTVNTWLDDIDSLDFTNQYACTIENVNTDKILHIIDTLKETTRKDSIIVNFNN